MFKRLLALVALTIGAATVVGIAYSAGGTMEQAQSSDWDCEPQVLILGYYHCAPPGKPSVLDAVLGNTTAPSLELRVFNPDGSFAGIESLVRADLYRGQPCWQDGQSEWGLLDLPVDYRACHRFETGIPPF